MTSGVGNCPICGTETTGQLIAGSVYDFQCDGCVEEVDDGFRLFLDAVFDDREPLPEGNTE